MFHKIFMPLFLHKVMNYFFRTLMILCSRGNNYMLCLGSTISAEGSDKQVLC
uniref:Uncharacterized protein n=1 Tax=Aegilops tauschii subsp. strangulata TaxID=200361 RepID=A0A453S3W2_AEGTS